MKRQMMEDMVDARRKKIAVAEAAKAEDRRVSSSGVDIFGVTKKTKMIQKIPIRYFLMPSRFRLSRTLNRLLLAF